MNNLKYKGYLGSIEDSENKDGLFGKVLGLTNSSITYEGTTIDELKSDFEAGVDDYLECCKENGWQPEKSFSGNLNVKIPSDIHSQIALLSERKGISINTYVKKALKRSLEFAE
jgi:predicted HicB family RNase H-like nuclease